MQQDPTESESESVSESESKSEFEFESKLNYVQSAISVQTFHFRTSIQNK